MPRRSGGPDRAGAPASTTEEHMHAHAHDHEHDHPHEHGNGHAHDHHTAAHRPHEEAVVLELGEELGALIVYADPALLHQEIEISHEGADDDRSHKDVLERVVGGRSFFTAVFDKVPDGADTLWHRDIAIARGQGVVGGEIAQPDPRPTAAAGGAGGGGGVG